MASLFSRWTPNRGGAGLSSPSRQQHARGVGLASGGDAAGVDLHVTGEG